MRIVAALSCCVLVVIARPSSVEQPEECMRCPPRRLDCARCNFLSLTKYEEVDSESADYNTDCTIKCNKGLDAVVVSEAGGEPFYLEFAWCQGECWKGVDRVTGEIYSLVDPKFACYEGWAKQNPRPSPPSAVCVPKGIFAPVERMD